MAINYWRPRASRTTQVSVYDINNSSTAIRATINGFVITGDTGGSRDATIDNAVIKWNVQTSPYFSKITATPDLATATQLILTADVSGVPFTVVIEEYHTAAWHVVAAAASSVAATGPEFYDNILNWSLGAVPVATNDVYFEPGNVGCCWNLPAAGPAIDDFRFWAGFTGVFGLNPNAFATSADGRTTDSTAREYRQTQWAGDIDDLVEIGLGEGSGSPRIRIEHTNNASALTDIRIYKTAATALDVGGDAVWIHGGSGATTDVLIGDCVGGVFLDTISADDIKINATSDASRVTIPVGSAFVDLFVWGGTVNVSGGSTTATTIKVYGGSVTLQDALSGQDLTLAGGKLKLVNQSIAIDDFTITGGTLDLSAIVVATAITALVFGVPVGDYKIITKAAGVFVPTATSITGEIDWRFEKAA